MTSAATGRPLRILYRAYGGDNTKPRPPYYSKLLAIVSLLRAAEALAPDPEVVFITDGVTPPERLRVMQAHGQVVPVRRGGSDSRSYREMLTDEAARDGADDDLIWLAEDDYLYVPDALARLVAGAAAQPDTDYFTLYGSRALDAARSSRSTIAVRPEPAAEGTGDTVAVGDVDWYRAVSTTSTFAIRRRALREDVRVLKFSALTGGAWDSATCKIIQGFLPFRAEQLRRDLLPGRSVARAQQLRSVSRGLVRVAAMPMALRRPSRRRHLMGSDPELVLHMEAPDVPPRRQSTRTAAIDWAAIAADTADWARQRGIDVRLPASR